MLLSLLRFTDENTHINERPSRLSSQERFTRISTSLAERDPTQVGVHDSVQVSLSVRQLRYFMNQEHSKTPECACYLLWVP
jgi:hypothetical protein